MVVILVLMKKFLEVTYPKLNTKIFVTFDRALANSDTKLSLLGFDHPIVADMINTIGSTQKLVSRSCS